MLFLSKSKITQSLFNIICNVWGLLSELSSPFFFLPPLVLRIRITNRCNLSCHYCYLGESLNLKNNNVLSLEEWKKIIYSIPRFTLIDITGGEPFLTPHIYEIIEMMLNRKLKISIITNGTIPKPELLNVFVLKKLQYFMVSFDGSRELHDEVRGIGSFDKSLNTIKEVIKLRHSARTSFPIIVCKLNITDSNFTSLHDLTELLLDTLKVDGVTFNLLFNNRARDGFVDTDDVDSTKLWSGNTMSFNKESISLMASTLYEIKNKYNQRISIKPEMDPDKIIKYFEDPSCFKPVRCFKYRSVATLYFDGVMTPCDLGLNVGNVRDLNYNIAKVRSLAEMKKFYQFFILKKRSIPGCAGCCLQKQEYLNEI